MIRIRLDDCPRTLILTLGRIRVGRPASRKFAAVEVVVTCQELDSVTSVTGYSARVNIGQQIRMDTVDWTSSRLLILSFKISRR